MARVIVILGVLIVGVGMFIAPQAAGAERASTEIVRDAAQATATARFLFPPTNTPRPRGTPLSTPTGTPTFTFTPVAQAPSEPIPGALCFDCNRLRVRATPGTAGEILQIVNAEVVFTIIGRTADNVWVQITLTDGTTGWIAARFARNRDRTEIDPARLSALPIMGVAVEASPTPTSEFLASVPSWLTGISSNARQIYLRGQAMGNRRNAFSKVGDSITATANFLYPFGFGQYTLGNYGGYSGAISFFGDSFVRETRAAAPGWTAVQLLTPGSPCGAVTPLVCEYQQHKPAVALIMIGTNDSGSGSPGVFADQLRQIVQITIDLGIVPVLSTIPPKVMNAEQTQRAIDFNLVITQTARQFDIPLWDYHANMVGLPNQGMSGDGLHPSESPSGSGVLTGESLQFGFTVRNRDALIVLDSMIRYVLY